MASPLLGTRSTAAGARQLNQGSKSSAARGDRAPSRRALRLRPRRWVRGPSARHPGTPKRRCRLVHGLGTLRRLRSSGGSSRRRLPCGGYAVEIIQQFETFARLAAADPTTPDRPYKLELAANWRSLPPVMMDIGPVLHMDDVVAGKMSALFTPAEPRDFLDVDAAVMTGRFARERLLEPAEQADAGFDRRVFADLLTMLQRYPNSPPPARTPRSCLRPRSDTASPLPAETRSRQPVFLSGPVRISTCQPAGTAATSSAQRSTPWFRRTATTASQSTSNGGTTRSPGWS
jgi:hypothetical protein